MKFKLLRRLFPELRWPAHSHHIILATLPLYGTKYAIFIFMAECYAYILGALPGLYIQGCIFRLTCSHRELTEDHLLTSAYVKIFRTITRNAVNKSV